VQIIERKKGEQVNALGFGDDLKKIKKSFIDYKLKIDSSDSTEL
jgi:hypothetical protein